MRRSNTKKLVRCALIAALYAAISLALTPITYGMMQARISEALTLLP
ncbi:MAG: QueT transporter family protein, partial [Ruthenibacterium sp.]